MIAARRAAQTWTPTGSCESRRPGWAQSHPGTPAKEGWCDGEWADGGGGGEGCAERLLARFQTRFSPPAFSPTGIVTF